MVTGGDETLPIGTNGGWVSGVCGDMMKGPVEAVDRDSGVWGADIWSGSGVDEGMSSGTGVVLEEDGVPNTRLPSGKSLKTVNWPCNTKDKT